MALSPLLVLAGGETLFRALGYRPTDFADERRARAARNPDRYVWDGERRLLRLRPSVTIPGEVKPGSVYRLNRLGMRGADPGPKTRPRVVLLGDSVLFGMEVDEEESFAGLLDGAIEVWNAGVPGYNFEDHRRRIAAGDAALWEADAAILCVCLNDFEPQGEAAWWKDAFGRTGWYGFLREMRHRAAPTERDVRQGSEEVRDEATQEVVRHTLPRTEIDRLDTVRCLDEIRDRLASDGIRLGLCVFPLQWQMTEPDPDRLYQEWLAAWARDRGVPYLDLLPAMSAEPDPGAILYDLYHLSPRGHESAARQMAPFLASLVAGE